jgi:FlaA1/EpsC-like NDP-sugar epimerase
VTQLRAERLARFRTVVQVFYDCGCWFVAMALGTWLRYDLHANRVTIGGIAKLVPFVVIGQLVAGLIFGMYRGRWRFGSFDEVLALLKGILLSTAAVYGGNVLYKPYPLPRSVPVAGGFVAFVLMGGGRYFWRLSDERRRRPTGDGCERLLVFGAGEGGAKIIRAMLHNSNSRYVPVAFLDDDLHKRNLRISGVPVVGTRDRLREAAATYGADALLIAIPSAPAWLITELSDAAFAAGINDVKVLPPVNELLCGAVGVADIRDVSPEDLLGRHQIHTDVDSIAQYLTGRRVLVTGAGGSIGSELCRQIYRFAPAELIMVDRDESALHGVSLSIHGRALLDSDDLVLLDIRDRDAVERVFAARRPHVVFHAAALKHLPILERHPREAVRTNVWATLDLLEVAAAAGAERFLNVSTDKAADPCSVLGYTKRISERLSAHVASEGAMTCLSVRFGNVLGSRGSVLSTFRAQIDKGGPVTVTHPDVTRYFMTVEEAVELVIQAGAIGRPGEVLVLDMGKPVRIDDVARVLTGRSERRVAIQYTGLRGGEKLHEVLLAEGEADHRPSHPLISQVAVEPLDPAIVRTIDLDRPDAVIVEHLAALCRRSADVTWADD